MTMTKMYYEFLVLINNKDCLKDIEKLRNKWKFNIFKTSNEAWNWLSKNNKNKPSKKQGLLNLHLLEKDCQNIIQNYQKLNAKNPQFVGLFLEFVLRNKILQIRQFKIKNALKTSLITNKSEDCVYISVRKGTTRQEYIENWEKVETMLNGLPDNTIVLNKRNKQSKFEVRLEIYKYYLRAKHQWNNPKDIIKRLYQMDEIDDLLRKLKSKTFHSQDSLRKIIKLFEKEYSHIQVISKSELNKPLIE